MKKNTLIISILAVCSFSVLFNSCSKDEDVIEKKDNALTTSHYILDGIDYTIDMEQNEDGTFDVVSVINEKLAEVLDMPNSTLLQDPFDKNTYYAFRTENDSKIKSAEIIQQMNQFEEKHGKKAGQNMLKSGGVVGSIEVFWDRYLYNPNPSYSPLLSSNGGYSSVGSFNDGMSSYRVWCNTQGVRPDGKRYVIRFYEDSNYGGHVLTAYGYFVNWESGGDYQVSWEDQNMHGTLMTGGIFNRKYWGDEVSSFKWTLE